MSYEFSSRVLFSNSSLITHHSSLITHHSSLITHHSSLITHHSAPSTQDSGLRTLLSVTHRIRLPKRGVVDERAIDLEVAAHDVVGLQQPASEVDGDGAPE